MRLLERTMKEIVIAPRGVRVDGLGGVCEAFGEGRRVRGSVIPSTGGLRSRESGLEQSRSMCLLLPKDARIAVGDGVALDGGEAQWRCVSVQQWSQHVAAQVERI